MRFLFVVHKNEEKAEQNSVLFHRLTLKERGLRPNGYFPLMRQPRIDKKILTSCKINMQGLTEYDGRCKMKMHKM